MDWPKLSGTGCVPNNVVSVDLNGSSGGCIVDVDSEQKEDEEAWFKKCATSATQFIGEQYRRLNKKYPTKKIFIHVTTATDQDNIKRVFWDVQNIIISKNLTGAGLV